MHNEVNILQEISLQVVNSSNASMIVEDKCPVLQVGQYSTLALSLRQLFTDGFLHEFSLLVQLRSPQRQEHSVFTMLSPNNHLMMQLRISTHAVIFIGTQQQHYETAVENVISPPSTYSPPAQKNKTTRRKKTSVRDRAVRPARTKRSSDEENACKASPTHHQQVQQSKTTSVPSVCRFVTVRRRGAATKHQLPKKRISVLNSSNDFSSGYFSAKRILRPIRRSKAPSTFILSSAENSVNVAGPSSVPTNPLQEISLNESSDPSNRPVLRMMRPES
ncbi:uncharacterized protein LOC114860098 [Betta splendens]|uniref:Uncharacterized protein LOC114852009 n=1 Tax=Betta splendens TaxID=158456 RepID=A0A6P7N784_BETSP|nr:uncharacterized protein LOC114852009 [Betta splendens]XP_029014233.1 uncharacterized protein LOC114860098 [Betta splendens]